MPVHDVTGKGLATTIKKELQPLSLDFNYMRGQGYDGAAVMSGAFNGVQNNNIGGISYGNLHSLCFSFIEFGFK